MLILSFDKFSTSVFRCNNK